MAGKRKIFWLAAVLVFSLPFVIVAQSLDPAALFPELDGWSRDGKAESFGPDNLYEHINGAAENFLAYDFRQLAVQNYVNSKKQSLSAEIYYHGTPENAFGIYSSEKPLVGNYIGIRTNLGPKKDKWTDGEGYEEEGVLNFICNSYYVKLNGFDLGPTGAEILKTIALKIAMAIPNGNSLPPLLDAFPASGKVAHSERYFLGNFLGHDFLGAAFSADYEAQGKRFKLFIMKTAGADHSRALLRRWLALDKENALSEIRPGGLIINDPYNGPVRISWKGASIWGATGQESAAAAHLEEIARNLGGL